MLHKTSDLEHCAIDATDGDIGRVKDLLFDDERWVVRWLVVDTGGWLSSREVLLPSSHLGEVAAEPKSISVDLTRERVKDSPGVDAHQPVSRQHEESIYGHYGWSPYWGGLAGIGGGAGYLVPPVYLMPGTVVSDERTSPTDAEEPQGDPHLRSTGAVRGYHIEATDGAIGHVEDFLVDSHDWSIRYVIVDTRNWWPGKRVLIAPEWARDINWVNRSLSVGLTRDRIKGAPAFDAGQPFDRDDEARLYGHYGLAGYWSRAPRTRASR